MKNFVCLQKNSRRAPSWPRSPKRGSGARLIRSSRLWQRFGCARRQTRVAILRVPPKLVCPRTSLPEHAGLPSLPQKQKAPPRDCPSTSTAIDSADRPGRHAPPNYHPTTCRHRFLFGGLYLTYRGLHRALALSAAMHPRLTHRVKNDILRRRKTASLFADRQQRLFSMLVTGDRQITPTRRVTPWPLSGRGCRSLR